MSEMNGNTLGKRAGAARGDGSGAAEKTRVRARVWRVTGPDGSVEELARVVLGPEGQAVITGSDPGCLKDLIIVEPGNPGLVLTAADGETFIRALPYNLAGTYVYASLDEGSG